MDNSNPYQSPGSDAPTASSAMSFGKTFAGLLFLIPIFAFAPLWNFVFHHAVDVMRPVHHDHRAGFLDVLFAAAIFVIVVFSYLPACILCWRSGTFPKTTKWLTAGFVLLLPIAIFFTIQIYFFFFPSV